jgi:hypothetical protein
VRPDYRAVDHLQTGVATPAVVEGLKQQLPQTRQRPAPELAINRRPFAEMLMQVAPRDTRSRNPENPIQNKTVVPRPSPAPGATLNHKRLKTGPFFVAHQTTHQGSLPKSYLESEINPVGNLEASVRSRGSGGGRGLDRDLIEAGLSEPAGWRVGYGD